MCNVIKATGDQIKTHVQTTHEPHDRVSWQWFQIAMHLGIYARSMAFCMNDDCHFVLPRFYIDDASIQNNPDIQGKPSVVIVSSTTRKAFLFCGILISVLSCFAIISL